MTEKEQGCVYIHWHCTLSRVSHFNTWRWIFFFKYWIII